MKEQQILYTKVPEVVMGTCLVERGPRADEGSGLETARPHQAEEVCGDGAEGAGGSVGRGEGVDVEDHHGHAAEHELKHQFWSRLVTVRFGWMS